MPRTSVSLLLWFSEMLSVNLVSLVTARSLHDNMLGVNRHLVSAHEISRLQHGLQVIMARYTSIINCRFVSDIAVFVMKRDVKLQLTPNCRPCCNLYLMQQETWMAASLSTSCRRAPEAYNMVVNKRK